ncbi:hypothetical protein NUACC21_27540 [Scytonema sp. NUACC21]
MAKITISDLRPADSEDSESFLHEITDIESTIVQGGVDYGLSQFLNFGVKTLEYALIGFAIYNIVSLVKLFMTSPRHRF